MYFFILIFCLLTKKISKRFLITSSVGRISSTFYQSERLRHLGFINTMIVIPGGKSNRQASHVSRTLK